MPAGILSDMIQQYKAIFEGEPIELGPEDSTPPPNQSTPEPSRTERAVPADATQASETTKRGNRNSMIYATNSDVLLNSVGRELTGKYWLKTQIRPASYRLTTLAPSQNQAMLKNQTVARSSHSTTTTTNIRSRLPAAHQRSKDPHIVISTAFQKRHP